MCVQLSICPVEIPQQSEYFFFPCHRLSLEIQLSSLSCMWNLLLNIGQAFTDQFRVSVSQHRLTLQIQSVRFVGIFLRLLEIETVRKCNYFISSWRYKELETVKHILHCVTQLNFRIQAIRRKIFSFLFFLCHEL